MAENLNLDERSKQQFADGSLHVPTYQGDGDWDYTLYSPDGKEVAISGYGPCGYGNGLSQKHQYFLSGLRAGESMNSLLEEWGRLAKLEAERRAPIDQASDLAAKISGLRKSLSVTLEQALPCSLWQKLCTHVESAIDDHKATIATLLPDIQKISGEKSSCPAGVACTGCWASATYFLEQYDKQRQEMQEAADEAQS